MEAVVVLGVGFYPLAMLATEAAARRVVIGLFGLLTPTLLVGWVGLRALRRYPLAG